MGLTWVGWVCLFVFGGGVVSEKKEKELLIVLSLALASHKATLLKPQLCPKHMFQQHKHFTMA